MTEYTRIRSMACNFRNESDDDDAAGFGWDVRRPKATGLLKAWKPSVILACECSPKVRAGLLADLDGARYVEVGYGVLAGGPRWGYARNGNVSVWFSKAHHEAVGSGFAMLPVPDLPDGSPGDYRRLAWVKLRHLLTGNLFYAASSHFSVGNIHYQNLQMQAVLDNLPDVRNTIFGVDTNSSVMTGSDHPRAVARAGGLVDLRSKLDTYSIRDADLSSFNYWRETPRNGQWIDDVFTGGNYQPYYGRVVRTDVGDGPNASDHNWILSSAIQLNDEAVA